jgi:MOSC domain-containing protein YiiM
MFSGRVEAIYIGPDGAGPMHSVRDVKAVAGMGLEGDRYFGRAASGLPKDHPGRQLTLVEAEAIDALNDDGLDVTPADSRRNVVTRGVPLNHLVGREFTVGEVRLRGYKLCEPCDHLEKLAGKPIREPLVHRGGLRAEILSEGLLRVGDPIEPA